LTNTQTTPLPAAAICATVGRVIGVPDGAADVGALGVAAGVAVGVAASVLVLVGVALEPGVDAAGPHATTRRIATRSSVFFMA
jgi:hypothetical protein